MTYTFVAEAQSTHYIQVRNDSRATTGVYLLRVSPRGAYDSFEPNDTVLQAKSIRLGEDVAAGIMDGRDDDYFVVETDTAEGTLVVSLKNRSTTLEPEFHIYDASKKRVRGWENGTPGADLSGRLNAASSSGTRYYIQVRNDSRATAGDYTLTVDFE